MDIDEKVELICRPPTEEVLTVEELRQLLASNPHPKHYIGFEISGMLHLGNFVVSGFKINDLIKAGVQCQVFLADWHSFINNKFGGDWDKILAATKYYERAFKFFCPGVKVVVGSELYHNNDGYWRNLLRFSKHMTRMRIWICRSIFMRLCRRRIFMRLARIFLTAVWTSVKRIFWRVRFIRRWGGRSLWLCIITC